MFAVSSWRSAEHGQVVRPVRNIGTVRSCCPGCVVTIAIAEQHVVLVLVTSCTTDVDLCTILLNVYLFSLDDFFFFSLLLCRVYQPSWNICTQVTRITYVRFLTALAGMSRFLLALAGMLRFLPALAGMLRFLAALAGMLRFLTALAGMLRFLAVLAVMLRFLPALAVMLRFLAALAGMLRFLAALAGMLRFLPALAGMLRFLTALAVMLRFLAALAVMLRFLAALAGIQTLDTCIYRVVSMDSFPGLVKVFWE